MDNCLKIFQLNCQRSYVAVIDFGELMRSSGVAFALLQEPFFAHGRVGGLPGGMRSFSNSVGSSAVVVDDSGVVCTVVSSIEWGVYVCVEGDFGFGLSLGYLLTGHGSLNAFLHAKRLSDTAGCRCGAVLEDWRIVLVECPLYADFRDLVGMGVVRTRVGWDFSGIVENVQAFNRLDVFARRLFNRIRVMGTG